MMIFKDKTSILNPSVSFKIEVPLFTIRSPIFWSQVNWPLTIDNDNKSKYYGLQSIHTLNSWCILYSSVAPEYSCVVAVQFHSCLEESFVLVQSGLSYGSGTSTGKPCIVLVGLSLNLLVGTRVATMGWSSGGLSLVQASWGTMPQLQLGTSHFIDHDDIKGSGQTRTNEGWPWGLYTYLGVKVPAFNLF